MQIGHRCPHFVIEEPVGLGSDRQTLVLKAPIASTDSVFILANDRDYIPSAGLFTSAQISATRRGPYRIARCIPLIGPDGDKLVIKTRQGSVVVTLPLGDQVGITQVTRAIRLATDLVLVVPQDGAITLLDNDNPSTESFIRISGGACDALGFKQFGARGREVYPPWQLTTYYDGIPTELPVGLFPVPARRPKFVRPLANNPTLKVTYTATSDRCPRCVGTYVENDYRFDLQGDMVLIQNENLLYQACLKSILTVLGSNPYHLAYGSAITTRIGAKAIAASQALIKEDIQTALGRVKSVQSNQAKYQAVTAEERLYAIGGIQVDVNPNDPTTFNAQVVVRNASNRPVLLNIVFTVPGVIALKGTNGLSLGVQPGGSGGAN